MRKNAPPPFRWAAVWGMAAVLSGCEALHDAGVPGMSPFIDFESRVQEEEHYRMLYRTERSPKAMRWLMANRLQSGMERAEVDRIFGESGEREYGDRWLKTNGGHYRSGDTVYKWGPDSEGTTVYLVFRDGVLVNYDPDEYRDALPAEF